MVGPVKPATPPGSAGQQASHTNLGPWDQVFNPRGSRRDWPKEHVDLFASLRALFSDPRFSTLAFSSTACPFPSAWARGSRKNNQNKGRQQDCVISQKLNWFYKQPELDFFIYWTFRWFPRINFFHRQKSKQLIALIGWAIVSSTRSKIVLSVIGKTKSTKPKQVKPSQTFGYTSVFLSGIAGASGEPKHGASSETRKPCKTGYIGGLQGDPLCGCKNGSKQQFLNTGFNERTTGLKFCNFSAYGWPG